MTLWVLFLGALLFGTGCGTAQSGLEIQHPPADLSEPIRVSGGEAAGHVLKRVLTDRPEEARRQHVGGGVVCRLVIDEEGHVTQVDPVSGNPLLRDAYVQAYRQWTYRPFLLNGQPVKVQTTVALNISYNSG